jgi:hypothetical protein
VCLAVGVDFDDVSWISSMMFYIGLVMIMNHERRVQLLQ